MAAIATAAVEFQATAVIVVVSVVATTHVELLAVVELVVVLLVYSPCHMNGPVDIKKSRKHHGVL